MKIYTKKGDKGDTSLFGGERVSKSSVRLEAYGSVDELNSVIGLVLSRPVSERAVTMLKEIQHQLLILGADLATPVSSKNSIDRIGEKEILFLEKNIDQMEDELPSLKNFILPGGCPPAATLHIARTVCRRAERAVVRCRTEESVQEDTVRYLNRLSDLLFVAARFENRHAGAEEDIWTPRKS